MSRKQFPFANGIPVRVVDPFKRRERWHIWYENNKEKKIEYICRRYIFKKEVARLMAILI